MAMGSFTLDLTKFCEKAKVAPVTVVKKVVFDMYGRIVARTPVDTGRARANWQIQVNGMSESSIIGGFSKSTKGRAAAGTVGWDSKVSKMTKISGSVDVRLSGSALAAMPEIKPGDVVYIFNNVEYIGLLEYGSSKQAPRGMVRITIQEFQAFIDAAVASLG